MRSSEKADRQGREADGSTPVRPMAERGRSGASQFSHTLSINIDAFPKILKPAATNALTSVFEYPIFETDIYFYVELNFYAYERYCLCF